MRLSSSEPALPASVHEGMILPSTVFVNQPSALLSVYMHPACFIVACVLKQCDGGYCQGKRLLAVQGH